MAITYKFTTLANGVNIEVFNGATQIADRNIVGSSTALVQKDFQDGTPISITVSVPEALYGNVFNLAGNTFIFDDVTVTGADNIQDAISAFFHKANTGTGGTGGVGIPNPMTGNYTLDANSFNYKVLSAGQIKFEAANAFVDLSEDSAILGVNGVTNRYLEVTPTGVSIVTNGVAAEVGGGGGGLTLASPDGSIWGLTVTNAGALDPVKLAASGEGGTINVFAANDTEWNLTISNEGVLSTTQI